MPCLIIVGHPSVGKTTFAHLLAQRALSHKSSAVSKVVTCNEASACPDTPKAACYSNSGAEKVTRAALKSEFDRAVRSCEDGGRTLVVLDSLNYIKGSVEIVVQVCHSLSPSSQWKMPMSRVNTSLCIASRISI